MNQTLNYYNENAAAFCEGTLNADMSHLYGCFLQHIPAGGKILDLGCGSGRDSLAFLRKGYQVEAVDGSEELCRFAAEYIGQPVRCMDFEELDYEEEFDGVWACASLLHAPKSRIPSILSKIRRSLVPGGTLYFSFKHGDSERTKDGRFFNDYTEDTVKELFTAENGWEITELFVTGDVREGRGGEQWVNGVVRSLSNVR
ncbi:MAG: class I SAM-dependent methyltransferase [Firmicutes bacterium]|nr:class I SAM-dependent methyltransferase [Bacillota bacterium]